MVDLDDTGESLMEEVIISDHEKLVRTLENVVMIELQHHWKKSDKLGHNTFEISLVKDVCRKIAMQQIMDVAALVRSGSGIPEDWIK